MSQSRARFVPGAVQIGAVFDGAALAENGGILPFLKLSVIFP
jgi:hypothetical protein